MLNAFAKNPKAEPYPERPYPIGEDDREEEQKKKEEQELLKAQLYMSNMVRAGKSWGSKG